MSVSTEYGSGSYEESIEEELYLVEQMLKNQRSPEQDEFAKFLTAKVSEVCYGSPVFDPRVLRKIGEGVFGSVYQIVDGKQFKALKCMSRMSFAEKVGNPGKIYIKPNGTRQIPGEVLAMTVSHPCLLKVEGVVSSYMTSFIYWSNENLDVGEMTDHSVLGVLTEYVDSGDLSEFIKGTQKLSGEDFRNIASQIGKGLAYLHENDLIHGDIKPENIFLRKDGSIRVADMGLLTPLMGIKHIATRTFTKGYGAPEQSWNALNQKDESNARLIDQKADAFSFGITLVELALGKSLTTLEEKNAWSKITMRDAVNNHGDESHIERALSGEDKQKLEKDHPGLLPLLKDLTRINPFKRISVAQFNERFQLQGKT